MRLKKSITIEPELWYHIQILAENELRNVSNMIEILLLDGLQTHQDVLKKAMSEAVKGEKKS